MTSPPCATRLQGREIIVSTLRGEITARPGVGIRRAGSAVRQTQVGREHRFQLDRFVRRQLQALSSKLPFRGMNKGSAYALQQATGRCPS